MAKNGHKDQHSTSHQHRDKKGWEFERMSDRATDSEALAHKCKGKKGVKEECECLKLKWSLSDKHAMC